MALPPSTPDTINLHGAHTVTYSHRPHCLSRRWRRSHARNFQAFFPGYSYSAFLSPSFPCPASQARCPSAATSPPAPLLQLSSDLLPSLPRVGEGVCRLGTLKSCRKEGPEPKRAFSPGSLAPLKAQGPPLRPFQHTEPGQPVRPSQLGGSWPGSPCGMRAGKGGGRKGLHGWQMETEVRGPRVKTVGRGQGRG